MEVNSAVRRADGDPSMKRQGCRQLRWGVASVCLLLLAVFGSRSAIRHSSDEEKGQGFGIAASPHQVKPDTLNPARIMSMAEIQAKNGVAPKDVAQKVKATENVDAVILAAVKVPNSKLVDLLKTKAAVYKKAGLAQLAAAMRAQTAAKEDKVNAHKELDKAAQMRKEADAIKQHNTQARLTFAKSEQPTLQADKAMKAADKAYRHAMLKMAQVYPEVGADKMAGKPVPLALEAELKNVTEQLKMDEALKKRDGEMLASAAAASTNSFTGNVGSSTQDQHTQSQLYGIGVKEQTVVKKAKNLMQLADAEMLKGKQAEVVAKRVLGVADCLFSHAKKNFYDEDKVAHVEHVYQRILDDCNA